MPKMTHLDDSGKLNMVDVGNKKITHRKAIALAIVQLPLQAAATLRNSQNSTKKGAVFQVAEIAGIMGAKKTSELIPLCHPLHLDKVMLNIEWINDTQISIQCEVTCYGKTGVEMEALTGANIAALTIYDMCKALSHDIRIIELKLIEKTGGKRDFSQINNTKSK
jgi:cyclic pyranopterin monophosphate synthase